MAVPKYSEFFPSFLLSLKDGKEHHINDIKEFCATYLNLSEKAKQEQLPSGKNRLYDRIGWARTYLKKAGLIQSTERAIFKLTAEGKKAIKNGVDNVNLDYLKQFESFKEFIGINKNPNEDKDIKLIEDETPEETLGKIMKQINSSLLDNLMSEIMKLSPYTFEKLIIKLLIKMGYGTSELNENALTKRSRDEGIDGIISYDKFGFDKIYIQAKQWSNNVGRQEIQKFVGALGGQNASKGLFVTTSNFSKDALDYSKKQNNAKIILINGEELCNLMIEHNLGVAIKESYYIKNIDYDFFNDEIEYS